MSKQETIDRLTAGLKDVAEFSPYLGARQRAAEILDFSQPLKLSAPKRLTGKSE